MNRLFQIAALTFVLALGFALGQLSPPALQLLSLAQASPAAPPRDDVAGLLEQCDARIRELRTARDQNEAERRLLALEHRICARWGDAESAAQLDRIAETDARLDVRTAALDRELEELLPIAAQLRALPAGSDLAPRPAWVDAARVRLRVAGLDGRFDGAR